MVTATSLKRSARYRAAAERFAEAVRREYGDAIRAVVLYGSVARGEARPSSDIDVLILTDDRSLRTPMVDIACRLDEERGDRCFTEPAVYTPEQFHHLVVIGSYYANDITREGVALYDDGTFARAHRILFEVSKRVHKRRGLAAEGAAQ